jgi:hypothetical protein
LVDLLSKREYIYRQYFENQFKLTHLPNILTANPKNPLINELKSSFLFVDPVTYTSEYSRDLYLHSLTFFKSCLLTEVWLPSLQNVVSTQPINLSILNKYLFFYFLDSNLVKNNNDQLLKSQYRPLRKGVNNMLRMHATGAVAMPIEIRIQILASSRDVIHS